MYYTILFFVNHNKNTIMRKLVLPLLVCLLTFSCQINNTSKIVVNINTDLQSELSDGRLLLIFSTNHDAEPRFGINDKPETNQVFGMDFENYQKGTDLLFDADSFGYPIENLSNIPEGDYTIQAFIQKHETFNRADGHEIKLPMDQGEGRQWAKAPNNIYSVPTKVSWKQGTSLELLIDQIIPPVEEPLNSKYVKHIKIKSDLLSEFWGRDIELGAHILLPEGFEDNPNDYYPLMIFHGHFPSNFSGFRTTPPDPDLSDDDYEARFGIYGYKKLQQQEAYNFYQQWIDPNFKRFIIIEIQHANPYYDDSYAVNSANLGPYGDAITFELVPFIEEQFRGIGEGWSRFLYGGSTGGWEALAAQVFYPNEYNGCFSACPDPIDFRAYTSVNIYEDTNAYYQEGAFRKTPRPGHRNYLGHVSALLKDMNHKELALGGDKSRSGDQFDIWQAVYSPVGADGYPEPIWNKYTGEINSEVAQYWKENYDLRHIMEQDWAQIGSSLEGKIHIYCGDMDNFYLNNAVYLTEAFLESTQNPYYNGEVKYGDRAEHCWNGDPDLPNYITRLRYNTMYLDKIQKRFNATAPSNFNLNNWTLNKK